MKKLAIIYLSFLYLSSYSQQYSEKWTNIDYADDGNSFHMLDIYLPKIVKTKYPVVIYIYGSAWFSNNLKGADMNTLGAALLDAGYAVVTPNHRSSSDSLFPAQIHDIKAVIRFVRANCLAYDLDTSFIGISGSSSGGHLAALAGTSVGITDYTFDLITMNIEGNLGSNLNFSSKVNAVCDWFGPTDLLKMDSCRGSMAYAEGQSPEEILIGCSKNDCRSKFVFINPITFIDPSDPPFLIFHGDADNVVPYCESQLLYDALQTSGVASEFVIVPGGQHYTSTHTEENFEKMIDFFNSISHNEIPSSIPVSFYDNEKTISLITINNELKIEGADIASFYKYDIVDMSGNIIYKNKMNQDRIDISLLKEGVYILRLYSEDYSEISLKFMKNNI
jgi:acetyl esterase/lipase